MQHFAVAVPEVKAVATPYHDTPGRVARSILGEKAEVLDSGQAFSENGMLFFDSAPPPVEAIPLPTGWRRILRACAQFSNHAPGRACTQLDGASAIAGGPYTAIKIDFPLALDDTRAILLPSEVGWGHLPGEGPGYLWISEDGCPVIQADHIQVTAERATHTAQPRSWAAEFELDDAYVIQTIADLPAWQAAFARAPDVVIARFSGRKAYFFEDGDTSWTRRTIELPLNPDLSEHTPLELTIRSADLKKALDLMTGAACLVVRDQMTEFYVTDCAGTLVSIRPAIVVWAAPDTELLPE